MSTNNVCRFIQPQNDLKAIHIVNYVLENTPPKYEGLKSLSVHRIHYVTEGEGKLHVPGSVHPLQPGDLFFVTPSSPYAIESTADLKYLYISFLGERANRILERLGIDNTRFLFHNFQQLQPFWIESINANPAMFDLRSESVLLYTLSELGARILAEKEERKKARTTASLIKKYIDDNYSDPDLSLEKIGNELSYNKKYISMAFKNEFRIGVSEYLNTVRIQHACTLISQGFTSIRDISLLCGYKDPLYFSRVFKSALDASPRDYMANMHRS